MNNTTKSWLFVIGQGILFGLIVFIEASPMIQSDTLRIAGAIIGFIGLIILLISLYDLRKSITALPLPKKGGQLQVDGLYKFARHPMYTGVLVLSLGISIFSGSILKYGILLALFLLFSAKASYEEKLLIARYPGYKSYMKKTPRFIPKIRT